MPITRDPPIHLRVSVLGRFDVRSWPSGEPLRLTGRHAQALFALLVLTRRPRSREAIAADLWPDADGACAGSLRQALWLVRQALTRSGSRPIACSISTAIPSAIRMDARIDLDLTAFEACLADGGCGRGTCGRALPAATCSRVSGTIASPPSVNGWPTDSRTRWPSSPNERSPRRPRRSTRRRRPAARARPAARGGACRPHRGPRARSGRARRSSASTDACSDVLDARARRAAAARHRGDLPAGARPDDASRAGAGRTDRARRPSTARRGTRRPTPLVAIAR